jgi:hypothetical protein
VEGFPGAEDSPAMGTCEEHMMPSRPRSPAASCPVRRRLGDVSTLFNMTAFFGRGALRLGGAPSTDIPSPADPSS